MEEISFQSLIDRLCAAFVPERAVGVDETIQFQLKGEQGGEWVVFIQDQTCRVQAGVISDPSLRFIADTRDAQEVLSGRLDPMQALLRGKVRFEGNMSLAMRLMKLFDIRRL